MVHPAHIFTQSEADAFNREVRTTVEAMKAKAARATPNLPELPAFTNWYDAREARLNFEMQTDFEASYASACEDHFNLCQRVFWLEEMLTTATADERKMILGYEKRNPLVPGELPTYSHVPGTIDVLRERRDDIEKLLPRLKTKADLYLNEKKRLEAWPWSRITRLRREEHERSLVAKGKDVQFRGPKQQPTFL